ncbi:FlaG/FlaF family flagellin (archaellin) [Caulobacter sp. 1776]
MNARARASLVYRGARAVASLIAVALMCWLAIVIAAVQQP